MMIKGKIIQSLYAAGLKFGELNQPGIITLEQILQEIEARGYTELALSTANKCKKGYVFELLGQGLLPSKIIGSYYYPQYPTFKADTPEDAAAKALLWILKKD